MDQQDFPSARAQYPTSTEQDTSYQQEQIRRKLQGEMAENSQQLDEPRRFDPHVLGVIVRWIVILAVIIGIIWLVIANYEGIKNQITTWVNQLTSQKPTEQPSQPQQNPNDELVWYGGATVDLSDIQNPTQPSYPTQPQPQNNPNQQPDGKGGTQSSYEPSNKTIASIQPEQNRVIASIQPVTSTTSASTKIITPTATIESVNPTTNYNNEKISYQDYYNQVQKTLPKQTWASASIAVVEPTLPETKVLSTTAPKTVNTKTVVAKKTTAAKTTTKATPKTTTATKTITSTVNYDLDKLARAVANHESHNCADKTLATSRNNCHGIMTWINGKRTPRTFATKEDSYEYFKNLWAKSYKSFPNLRLAQIYSGNDQAHTWLRNVIAYYNNN